jgi:hypothetical protein
MSRGDDGWRRRVMRRSLLAAAAMAAVGVMLALARSMTNFGIALPRLVADRQKPRTAAFDGACERRHANSRSASHASAHGRKRAWSPSPPPRSKP